MGCLKLMLFKIVLLGKPYKNRKKIEQLFPLAEVKQNVFSVSNLMSISDLAFTSSGRTSFELTHINVPCIISSQNSREEMREQIHTLAYLLILSRSGLQIETIDSIRINRKLRSPSSWLCN